MPPCSLYEPDILQKKRATDRQTGWATDSCLSFMSEMTCTDLENPTLRSRRRNKVIADGREHFKQGRPPYSVQLRGGTYGPEWYIVFTLTAAHALRNSHILLLICK
jgi:hypothetical protein